MGDDFSLDLDNLLTDDQIQALDGNQAQGEQGDTPPEPNGGNNEENIVAENLEISDLFGGSESVGNEEGLQENGDTPPAEQGDSDSPDNLYSSFAGALKVDGVFSNLDDSEIEKIVDGDTFLEAMKKQIQLSADEQTRRVNQALDDGVEPSQIKTFESSISNLNAVTNEAIEDESENGVDLRKNLIYNDYLAKGMSKERALALTERSIGSANEIDDAKEALKSLKDHYETKYKELLDNAHKEAEASRAKFRKESEELKNSILNDPKAFGVEVDEKTRRRMYEVITKPVDKEGKLTEVLKLNKENKNLFLKGLAYSYVITDGFKNLNKLSQQVEREAKRKGVKELENIVNSTSRNKDGSLRLVRSSNNETDSGGWSIDS